MNIDEFDKIYCINLARRKDRRSQCENIFKANNINVEFIEAVDGSTIQDTKGLNPGAAGCCLSHKKIFDKMSSDRSLRKVLILEDDVEFDPDFKNLFTRYYQHVPENWNLLFFGGSHNLPPKPINQFVHKLVKTFTTHCYAVNNTAVGALLEQFSDSNIFNLQADVHLYKIQKKIPCYGFRKHLAWQREGWSDIEGGHRKYDFLK